MKPYFRFLLDPKGKKHKCFGCGQKTAVLYYDVEVKRYLPEQYSKCDRANNCGYHINPYTDGYAKTTVAAEGQPQAVTRFQFPRTKEAETGNVLKQPQKHVPSIPLEVFKGSLRHFDKNNFVRYLANLFTPQIASKLISQYFIGTSSSCYRKETGFWRGSTVFWLIDINGNIRAGQIKLFDDSGHTCKYVNANGDTKSCTSWMHSALARKYSKENQPLPEWLQQCINGEKVSCLFGEHLLKDKSKPVAVVEAPKTAIIASIYLPQFIWLAVGALTYLTEERCKALAGRNVVLYPDLNGFGRWSEDAKKLSHLANFTVSDLLERKANKEERKSGLDLADYLTRYDYREFMQQGKTDHELKDNSAPLKLESEKSENSAPQPVNVYDPPLPTQGDVPSPQPELNLEELGAWDEQIQELREFFGTARLPAHPVRLNAWTTVSDPATFIDSHLSAIRHNNGKRSFLPYLERLQSLKAIISTKQNIHKD
jgi:hypothetical protein